MPNRIRKEILLGVLTISALMMTLLSWERTLPFILSGNLHYQNYLFPFAIIIISATLFLCTALFVETAWMSYGVPVIGIIGGIFYFRLDSGSILLGIISVLLALVAIHRVRREFGLSLGFSISKLSKAGLPLFFTVCSLIISYFYIAHINDANAIATLIPKPAFTALLGSLAKPISGLTGLPPIPSDATVDEALTIVIGEELKKQGVSIANASKSEIARFIALQREALEKQYDIRVRGNEHIGDILYTMAANQIVNLLGPYTIYLPAIAGVAFFFAFKALSIPLYILTLMLTFLLIKLLVATKLLKQELRQTTVERLTL